MEKLTSKLLITCSKSGEAFGVTTKILTQMDCDELYPHFKATTLASMYERSKTNSRADKRDPAAYLQHI